MAGSPPDIVDAEFEEVLPANSKALTKQLRTAGINDRELRDLMTANSHPWYMPGGRYYQRWDVVTKWLRLRYLPAALILAFGVADLASDGAVARWIGSVIFG